MERRITDMFSIAWSFWLDRIATEFTQRPRRTISKRQNEIWVYLGVVGQQCCVRLHEALHVKRWWCHTSQSACPAFPCGRTKTIRIECFHMTSWRPYWCPKTMKRRPCWCPKPVLWELNSFLMQTLSFVPINLHRCWRREWKHSIRSKNLAPF